MRFLFNTLDVCGGVNPMISLAQVLQSRGHDIIFVTSESFRQTIEKCGFVYEAKLEFDRESSDPQVLSQHLMSIGIFATKSSIECIKIEVNLKPFVNVVKLLQKCETNIIGKCIEKYKPDVIVQHNITGSAESVNCGLPWVGIYCENPLNMYCNDLLPPFMSGYALNGDSNEWRDFKFLKKQFDDLVRDQINESYKKYGFPEINTRFPISPYLNIYGYPKELDYSDIVEVPKNWIRVDSFVYEKLGNDFVLPKQLKNKSGKLIYVGMGTLVSINLDFMKNLVSVLAKSPHRFIVSKGVRSSEYSLCDNMWGDSYLPQTVILPKVDLFITHGGNNSITEAFTFGKPMIVLPIMYDQYDNAQRIHETGFGIRLNAQQFTENELLAAIETLLNDTELNNKMKNIAKRIQTEESLLQAVKLIENLKDNIN